MSEVLEGSAGKKRICLSGAGGEEALPEAVALACAVGSWLCHDLASPLGAMAGSLDLLETADPALQEEARAILRDALEALTSRLAFDRIAFGRPGAGPVSVEEGRRGLSDPGRGRERPAMPVRRERPVAAPPHPRASWPGSAVGPDSPEGEKGPPAPSPEGARAAGRQAGAGELRAGSPGRECVHERVPVHEMRRLLGSRFGHRHDIVLEADEDLSRPEARRLLLAILAISVIARNGSPIRAFREAGSWHIDFVPADRAERGALPFSWGRIGHPAAALLDAEAIPGS